MAFWNRDRNEPKPAPANAVERLTRVILDLRHDVENLRREVDQLHIRVNGQPVPTNGQGRTGGGVQEWLPVVDRLQELLLVQMGNADLAQAFGTYARQRELRESEQPETTWTEPNESTYEAY
ncbi:hypothetical protein AMJ85_00260 [candidate division BRC1 bacterium SM23_51]|nr:MAG: hypothetical protein AMJ85_00260 [candidate division BRC1 bacterium SM23_51]